MNTVGVFAVLDMKMKAFMAPFTAQNGAVACRMFQDSVANQQGVVAKHPEDFALYEVGSFDESTGLLVACSPVNLGLAVSFVERPVRGNGHAEQPAVG